MQIKNIKSEEGNIKIIDKRSIKKSKLIKIKTITLFLVIALLSLSYFYLDPSITGFSELELGSLFNGNETNETTIDNSTNITEAEYSIQPVDKTEISNLTNETLITLVEKITENLTTQTFTTQIIDENSITFDRSLDCQGCGIHRAP